jgi:hypothetical protein
MQFNVPQFTDVEDKVIGPFTLKQFLLLLGGAVLVVILWYFFKLWVVIGLGAPLILILLASALIKINGRPLPQIFIAWLKYFSGPKIFIWKRKNN